MVAWTKLPTFDLAPSDIVEPWKVALEDWSAATAYLKIKASGAWTAMAGLPKSGPDGVIGQSFANDQLLVVADCPVGALIGRIGGSSATLKAAAPASDSGESKPFAIGAFTVVKLPANAVGPLYVGFNILLRPLELENLSVEIWAGT